jgi:pyruvate carboxylase
MFMTANDLSSEDILENGDALAFPDSVKSLVRGELGKVEGGFPPRIVEVVLKDEPQLAGDANEHLAPVDFDKEMASFAAKFGEGYGLNDFLSYILYPKVFEGYHSHAEEFGDVSRLPTIPFFYGLKTNEEVLIEIAPGKTLLITFMNMTEPDVEGNRLIFFRYNGTTRSLKVRDQRVKSAVVLNKKAEGENEVGAPLQGSLGSILVKEGQEVKHNQPLFTIEAMKMESTVVAQKGGKVKKILLREKTLVQQGDAVMEMA